jgi:hypothetical protein
MAKKGGYVLNPGYSGAPARYPSMGKASKHQVGASVPTPTNAKGGSPEVITTKMPGGKSQKRGSV